MKSSDIFIKKAGEILQSIDCLKNGDDVSMKDILTDIKLMLYAFAPDFPLLADVDRIADKTYLRMNQKKIGYPTEIDDIDAATAIVQKFMDYIKTYHA